MHIIKFMTLNIYNIFVIIMIVITFLVLHSASLNILLTPPPITHGYTVYTLYLANGGMHGQKPNDVLKLRTVCKIKNRNRVYRTR